MNGVPHGEPRSFLDPMTALPHNWSKSRARFPLQKVPDRVAVLVLVVVSAIALSTFREYGLGWDDYAQSEYGDLLVALYASGFRDTRALSFVNLYEYGGGFDLAASLLAKVLPFGVFPTRRWLGAIIGIVGLLVTWRTARRLGGPIAGMLALILLAACPLYYGHMFMNAKDAPFAVAMTILLYGLVRIFEDYPRPAPASLVAFAIGLGLAIGSRIIGGVAAVDALGAVVLLVVSEAQTKGLRHSMQRLAEFLLRLLPAFVVSYLVMGLVWPWAVIDPLNPVHALIYFSRFFEQPWKELFAGILIAVPDMPWTYLPTLLTLIVFLTPPIAVLCGLAGARLLDRLRRYGPAPLGAAIALLLFGIALPVIEMVRLHPYQYTYFNHLAGSVPAARNRYMLDYWGLSFKEASEKLLARLAERGKQPPAGRRWIIATCGPHRPAQVALGPDFETTWESKGADFALMLGEFYCAKLDAPILAEVTREGVVYARVYDLRGKTIPSLLTIPPP